MGLYLRKSFRFGPLRLNLSRSGFGLSGGVKGARVGIGPRGRYVHAGRHGLYYRKHLSSGRRGKTTEGDGAGCATTLLGLIGAAVVVWLFTWLMDHPVVLLMTLVVVVGAPLSQWLLRLRKKRLVTAYKQALDQALVRAETPPSPGTLAMLKEQQAGLPQGSAQRKQIENIEAHIYQAVLDSVLDDGHVTKEESARIAAADQLLTLEPHVRLEMKKETFSSAYLEAIEDRAITEDELKTLNNLIEGLAIPRAEVERELDIVQEILDAQALKLPLVPLPRSEHAAPVQKSEEVYDQRPAQVLSRRKSKTSPSGYEYNVRRDGTMVLTNKRVLVVGEGRTRIRYGKIADVDVDLDHGVVEVWKKRSGRPIILKTDAPVYTGRVIDLLMQARADEQSR